MTVVYSQVLIKYSCLGPAIMYDHDVFVKDDEICLNDLTVHWGSFSHLVCGLV